MPASSIASSSRSFERALVSDLKMFEEYNMNPTILAAYIFLGVASCLVLGCIWRLSRSDSGSGPLTLLICVVGALVGLCCGVLLFPARGEEQTFAELRKGVGLVVSGYIAAKVDPILTQMFKGERNATFVSRAVVALSAFLIALIATFYARWYGVG